MRRNAYPSVFVEFAATTERYGDVGVLATPVFFYGMDVMHELEIELERGKTLSVRFAASANRTKRVNAPSTSS